MRFLKRQALDRRTANNTTLYSDTSRSNVYVSPIGQGSLVLPNGPTSAQPASPSSGMMRYDTTTNQVMVYQGTAWRALRFKESTQITQQSLGLGNALNTLFGPLNPAPPAQVQSSSTWSGSNLLVYVENVPQLYNSNFLMSQNPVTETTVSVLANSGSTSLTLSSVTDVNVGDTLSTAAPTTTVSTTVNTVANTATYTSGGVTSTTMVVGSFSGTALVAGQLIVGTGFSNGQYITAVSGSGAGPYTITLSAVANTQPSGTLTFDVTGATPLIGTKLLVTSIAGITAGMFVYGQGFNDDGNFGGSQTTVVGTPTGNIVTLSSPPDSTVTGTLLFTTGAGTVFAASTTVTSVNTFTGVITLSQATTGGIAANRAIQVSRPVGYYLRFTSSVPSGKPVTVLSGFDQ